MQLISREKLFKLANSSSLSEDETLDFNYEKFKAEWKYVEREIRKENRRNRTEDLIPYVYRYIELSYLPKIRKNIQYVKEGPSRNIFVLTGGKCLKVVTRKSGITENKQEVKNYRVGKKVKLNCFAKIYDVDRPSYSSLIADCYAHITLDDFETLLGMPLKNLVYQIQIFIYDTYGIGSYEDPYDYRGYKSDEDRDNQIAADKEKFQKNCLNNKDPNWDVIRDLLRFYKENKNNVNEILPEDLNGINDWGLVLRNNKPVLVRLNFGDSEQASNDYFNI